jgi:hypothetical protein
MKDSTLGTKQQEQHQLFVEWFERYFDLPLAVGVHSKEFRQPQKTRIFLEKTIGQLDDWALTGNYHFILFCFVSSNVVFKINYFFQSANRLSV